MREEQNSHRSARRSSRRAAARSHYLESPACSASTCYSPGDAHQFLLLQFCEAQRGVSRTTAEYGEGKDRLTGFASSRFAGLPNHSGGGSETKSVEAGTCVQLAIATERRAEARRVTREGEALIKIKLLSALSMPGGEQCTACD